MSVSIIPRPANRLLVTLLGIQLVRLLVVFCLFPPGGLLVGRQLCEPLFQMPPPPSDIIKGLGRRNTLGRTRPQDGRRRCTASDRLKELPYQPARSVLRRSTATLLASLRLALGFRAVQRLALPPIGLPVPEPTSH